MNVLKTCWLDSPVFYRAFYRLVLFDPDWNPATDSQVRPSYDSLFNARICFFPCDRAFAFIVNSAAVYFREEDALTILYCLRSLLFIILMVQEESSQSIFMSFCT